MPLKRSTNWATEELQTFLETRAAVPFAWGTNDCALFAADAIQSMTGQDIATDFRGKYRDEASAFVLVKSVTGGSAVADAAAWCAKSAGLEEYEHPRLAQRGDLVVMAIGDLLIAGIVHLNGRQLVSVSEVGLVLLPITAVRRAWKV